MTRFALVALALAACADEPGTELTTETGTQSPDSSAHEGGWGCEEVSREAIADPAVVEDGFASSPEEGWALAAQRFTGQLDRTDGGAADVELMLDSGGAWELVQLAPPEPDPDGTEDLPAIYLECPSYYARTASLVLQSSPELDEVLPAEVRILEDGGLELGATIGLEDLVGTASPAGFEASEVDSGALRVAGWMAAGEERWSGELSFSGALAGTGGEPSVAFLELYATFDVAPSAD